MNLTGEGLLMEGEPEFGHAVGDSGLRSYKDLGWRAPDRAAQPLLTSGSGDSGPTEPVRHAGGGRAGVDTDGIGVQRSALPVLHDHLAVDEHVAHVGGA